jgi:hypothetical protein
VEKLGFSRQWSEVGSQEVQGWRIGMANPAKSAKE